MYMRARVCVCCMADWLRKNRMILWLTLIDYDVMIHDDILINDIPIGYDVLLSFRTFPEPSQVENTGSTFQLWSFCQACSDARNGSVPIKWLNDHVYMEI